MEQKKNIIQNSSKRINKIKLLNNFLPKLDLIPILIRTEIIHNLFVNDSNLDPNNLELFHVQYTDSLISLLEKIKKQKESLILIIFNEIDINDIYIQKEIENNQKDDFDVIRKYHNSKISDLFKLFYDAILNNSKFDLPKEIYNLSEKYSQEYYHKDSKIKYLLSLEDVKYYEFNNLKIEKKLIGRLNKSNFKVRFICGYYIQNQIFELFMIPESKDEFIWELNTNKFYLLEEDISVLLNKKNNESSKKTTLNVLQQKNEELKKEIEHIKNEIPKEIHSLIQNYIQKINSQSLSDTIFNIDEELNILKNMLNLNINNKNQ